MQIGEGMGMDNMLRIAIIGIGGMGKKYAKMINDGKIDRMILSAVCARSVENQKWIEENLSDDVMIYYNADEMFTHVADYDAVLIVTPHKSHPELAIRAFEAGKHVFCDKPAGVSVSDAMKMQESAQKHNKKYAMMFHNRTYPVIAKMKELIENNEVGKIQRMILENSKAYRTSYYHHSGSWRSSWNGEGGGALINQGQHILDYWQWLFGMPDSIYANIAFGKYNDFAVDDEATLVMQYSDNVSAVFLLTTGEIQPKEELSVIGSKGKITVVGNDIIIEYNNIDAIAYGKTAQVNSRENMKTTKKVIHCDEPANAYEIMLTNFCGAVFDGQPLIATGQDGINTLEITNAAYMSAWKDQKITLPINPAEYDRLLNTQINKEKM